MSKKKHFVVVPGEGDSCPRCGRSTQIREHDEIREKHLRQPYYFSRWFYCCNPACVVTLHMAERYKVVNQAQRKKEAAEASEKGQVVWGETWDDVPSSDERPPWE